VRYAHSFLVRRLPSTLACMTPAQEVARRRRLVGAARNLLSLESSLVAGASQVRKALRYLGDEYDARFPTFGRFLDAIPAGVPLGEVRLICAENFLFETDAQLAILESEFRPSIIRECLAVLNEFDQERRNKSGRS
jgi:hypothetical protein